MSDGSSLRESWNTALNKAESHFHALAKAGTGEWKRCATTSSSASVSTASAGTRKGKGRLVGTTLDVGDVVVHRKVDVFRLILEVPSENSTNVDSWETLLGTPELRKEWDPAVVEAHLVEVVDERTRVSKTKYVLGWPANPRDAVTISRSFKDGSTYVDISTSLPRDNEAPAYLRPAPPYVRSNVTLFAWCIQHIPSISPAKTRITCFWQHDLRAPFSLSSPSTSTLAEMVLGLYKSVMKRGGRTPKVRGWGQGVAVERVRFDVGREALGVDYAVIPDDGQQQDERWVECVLPAAQGWDVQVSVKGSGGEGEWRAHAMRLCPSPSSFNGSPPAPPAQILLRLTHPALFDDHAVVKAKLVIEISGPSSGLRLNGIPHAIAEPVVQESQIAPNTAPSVYSPTILQDFGSVGSLSFNSSASTSNSSVIASPAAGSIVGLSRQERTPAAEKSILSRVKRNYIYFSSLLQEPEAKWKRTTEARGVTITQLDSIDPTLVVYRAEATFVGVGMWDLYGAIATPGAKNYWDKGHEDAVLLEDVNELTELWHLKTKGAWPVNGRDSVVLKTVYKSPSTIHVFAFSADDPHLFPTIPPADPNVIRTQVDLQGWAIEALSPTTTQVTLLEQSDPKGWTNKTSIPNAMIGALAGIGEFTIKCGGPPVMTRLGGARASEIRYDHERMSFRVEYLVGKDVRNASPATGVDGSSMPIVECELRCDIDTWASSLDIVIDPPPQSISALRRHKLSHEGGGLWLTIVHDAVFVDEERLLCIVRRGPGVGKESKGVVMVNGAKVPIDVEEMTEEEQKERRGKKRIKPLRVPLDQPPVISARRRNPRTENDLDDMSNSAGSDEGRSAAWAPKISSPLSRFFTFGSDSSASKLGSPPSPPLLPEMDKPPIQYALDALAWVRTMHSPSSPTSAIPRPTDDDSWITVSDKSGLPVKKRLCPEISSNIPVYKSQKVIEGVSAEELAGLIIHTECRRKWDPDLDGDGSMTLQTFGGGEGARTGWEVRRAGFPWRDRGFWVACAVVRDGGLWYIVQASIPAGLADFEPTKVDPYGLPLGRMHVDAWLLETLDPYSMENYAVPSALVGRWISVDFGGSMPVAMGGTLNISLARTPLNLEAFVKKECVKGQVGVRLPGLGVSYQSDDESEEDVGEGIRTSTKYWQYRRRDQKRKLIRAGYIGERAFKATVLLTIAEFKERNKDETRTHRTKSVSVDITDITPRPSRISATEAMQMAFDSRLSTGTTSGLPSSSSSTISGLAVSPSSRLRASSTFEASTFPSTTSSTLSRAPSPMKSPSVDTLRGRAISLTSTFSSNITKSSSKDRGSSMTLKEEQHAITVAELVVDSKLYPEGYTVEVVSCLKPHGALDLSSLHSTTAPKTLPFTCTAHTIPLSPLHSSGMNTAVASRELVRVLLDDSFLGDEDLVVEVTMTPRPGRDDLLDAQKGVEIRNNIMQVKIGSDIQEVEVVGEKASLTELGREALCDERVAKLGELKRTSTEIALPCELLEPIAVSMGLLRPDSSFVVKSPMQEVEKGEPGTEGAADGEVKETILAKNITPTSEVPPESRPAGFLQFLQNYPYPNPLTRFTTSSPPDKRKLVRAISSVPYLPSSSTTRAQTLNPPGGLYPLSTLVITALITFLIGSLLRSLLSPADFIYVATDLSEVEAQGLGKVGEGGHWEGGGWREIRRLFELKYVFGGWDFQVAVVRRH